MEVLALLLSNLRQDLSYRAMQLAAGEQQCAGIGKSQPMLRGAVLLSSHPSSACSLLVEFRVQSLAKGGKNSNTPESAGISIGNQTTVAVKLVPSLPRFFSIPPNNTDTYG